MELNLKKTIVLIQSSGEEWKTVSIKVVFNFYVFRYTNHLDSSIVSKEFTPEDEEKLFMLHDKIGNKWSLISK